MTGRKSKKTTQPTETGAFHALPEKLQDSLLAVAKKNGNKSRKQFTASLPIRLILDRLLYASDASDARSSLGQLQERIRRRSSSSSTDEQQRDSEVLELAGEHTFVSILCQLILNSQLFGNDEETVGEVQKSPIDLEDGSILACDLLLNLLASSSTEEEEENNLKSSKPRTSVEYIAAKALLSPSLSTGSTSSTVAADEPNQQEECTNS